MRKITSLTLVLAGIIEIITSIVLYILPSGRVAYWADYRLFGLSKTQWGDIHITVGTLLLAAAVLHLYYNWKPMMSYIKNRAKELAPFNRSFNVALLLTLYVTIGTLFSLPPMNYIVQLGTYFTDTANVRYGEPPYGHAELSSLKMFCSKMHLDLTQVMELLPKKGIKVEDANTTVLNIAQKHNLSPQQLYEIMKTAAPVKEKQAAIFPDAPLPGFGTKTIKSICESYNLPLQKILNTLQEAGFAADEDDTVKEIGVRYNSNPMAVFEIIKNAANELYNNNKS